MDSFELIQENTDNLLLMADVRLEAVNPTLPLVDITCKQDQIERHRPEILPVSEAVSCYFLNFLIVSS